MGDTGSRRSTLVSRLPIFRRSSSKRRDSLPSSPSSATNGVHTSSPSSTNSSSSSMGKRRNIFRTASIGFHGRKAAGEPRASTLCNGQSNSPGEEGARARGRHAFGLSVVPRGKKITRSATEDFEKGKELNKSVFMNCLSSGRSSVDEGDDSGFPDDRPPKQRSRKLLPRSFSTHHKLSKPAAARSPPAEQPVHVLPQANELVPRGPALEECSKYLQVDNAEGSLHSPLLSSDNTTILTPSEFVPVSADSVSEVDKELLGCRPAPSLTELGPALSGAPLDSLGPAAEAAAPHLRPSEDVLPLRETALLSDVEPRTPHAAEVCPPGIDCLEMKGSCESDGRPTQLPGAVTPSVPSVKHQLSFTQNGLEATKLSTEKAYKLSITNSIPMIKPQDQCQGTSHSTVTVNRTFSPRHEEKWVERRLRSSSEGTSGRRLSHGVRDGRVEELHSLKGQRAGSSSSKMNSMDVLNRLGSCDLDEDDLMLDLEFLEDQHHQCDRDTSKHFVCREDSNQSIKSCVEILHVPTELKMKIERPKVPETPKELPFVQSSKEGELCESRPLRYNHWLSAASSDWSLLREDEPGGGLEAMSLRLMMQDCTAVKTMLLKLKRILQESVEMSPASSTHSLPVSPITEMPIPFKDLKDESSLLRLQLKEKDELISQLRDELDRNRRAHSSRADKSTQTEILSHDPTCLNRTVSQTLSTRDRRLVPIPTEDPCKYSSPSQAAAHDGKTCQVSNVYVGRYQKAQEVGRGAQCKNGVVEASSVELAENIQSNGACSGSTQSKIKTTVNAGEVLELMNGRKDQVTVPRQQSVFVGRLGQPPRGPLSLHMYSRKNVFLQHSLYTSDLQALGQKDG
ncbi:serine-rich coiled-coil domain-containing protein 1 [Hemiscyllium ocellatum]|uniref:serine-rich coiled-coil domain-containing protein 1 n=1 Tax=Hemiscyllium ocellatum TaxID=170820 RepID=UPI00296662D7|nr:serine-rich coiled-coil domain-containing protein 1 [Hemiscyllium ocellatum]